MVKLQYANAPVGDLGLRVAFGRLSRGLHGPGISTGKSVSSKKAHDSTLRCSSFRGLSEEGIYLLAILLSHVATIALDILRAPESRVVQKVHVRVFISRYFQIKEAYSTRGYTTYRRLNFPEALVYHGTA